MTMKLYSVSVRLQCVSFTLFFTDPPVRKDIAPLLEGSWRKLSTFAQDHSWDMLLIIQDIPNIPWLGEITTTMGYFCCREVEVTNNAKSSH